MSIKKLFAVLFAVCAVLFSSSAVCAEPVTEDYSLQSSEEAVTTAPPVSEYEDSNTETSQQTTVSYPDTVTTTSPTTTAAAMFTQDTPTLEPTKVFLEVGEIKNMRFKVKLNISPKIMFSEATINVEYDSALLELENSEINESEIGGIPVDSQTDGKYTFTYMNTSGTQYDGTYSTLTFRINDKTMVSTVIYVSVESLEDMNLLPIANVIQNGIVNYHDAEPAAAEIDPHSFTEIKLIKSDEPVSLESLGILDVKEATVSDDRIVLIENGEISTLGIGQTDLTIVHNDESESYYRLIVSEPEKSSVAESKSENKVTEASDGGSSSRTAVIIAVVIAGIAAIAVEYIIIVKPFDKHKDSKTMAYEQDFAGEEESDESGGDTDETNTSGNSEES